MVYNGVQDRAYNTAVIATVRNTVELVDGYIAANDSYPYRNPGGSATYCATNDDTCQFWGWFIGGRSTALLSNLATIGTPPSAPSGKTDVGNYGVGYEYDPSATWNGQPQPVTIVYSLKGTGTDCGLPNSNIGTVNNGTIQCTMHIDGPST